MQSSVDKKQLPLKQQLIILAVLIAVAVLVSVISSDKVQMTCKVLFNGNKYELREHTLLVGDKSSIKRGRYGRSYNIDAYLDGNYSYEYMKVDWSFYNSVEEGEIYQVQMLYDKEKDKRVSGYIRLK